MRAYVRVWLDSTWPIDAEFGVCWVYLKGQLDFAQKLSVIKVKVTDAGVCARACVRVCVSVCVRACGVSYIKRQLWIATQVSVR